MSRIEGLISPVVCLGNFDGVHTGHQEIFNRARESADHLKGHSVAFTFDPHPIKVLSPDKYLPLITPLDKKIRLIEKYGIAKIIIADFDGDFACLNPHSFVKDILLDLTGAKELVVGFNYAFGKGRSGGVDFLRDLSESYKFKLHVVEPVRMSGVVVSSSKIREAIWTGMVDTARCMLGRPYGMEGKVIEGRHRGKSLGFPTINISTDGRIIPKSGVYATLTVYRGEVYKSVSNIGKHPTFPDDDFSVEAHILDFNKDIYGEDVELLFIERIRDEIAFSGPEALSQQISHDVMNARELLS